MPLFVRKFIVDFVETAIGMIFAINIAFPHSLSQAQQAAVIVGTAIASALVSAARRATPDFIGWLKGVLGVS